MEVSRFLAVPSGLVGFRNQSSEPMSFPILVGILKYLQGFLALPHRSSGRLGPAPQPQPSCTPQPRWLRSTAVPSRSWCQTYF